MAHPRATPKPDISTYDLRDVAVEEFEKLRAALEQPAPHPGPPPSGPRPPDEFFHAIEREHIAKRRGMH